MADDVAELVVLGDAAVLQRPHEDQEAVSFYGDLGDVVAHGAAVAADPLSVGGSAVVVALASGELPRPRPVSLVDGRIVRLGDCCGAACLRPAWRTRGRRGRVRGTGQEQDDRGCRGQADDYADRDVGAA